MRNKKVEICLAIIIALTILDLADARIIVYSAPWCGFCVKLEQYLKEQNINFKKINIDNNRIAKKEMEQKSGQRGIPVLDWDEEIIVGFGESQKKEIDRLIAGGFPVRGKFVSSEMSRGKTNNGKPQYDSFYGQIKNLENLFAIAEKNIDDVNTADILKKLYDAHISRVIYESTFTKQFQKIVEETSVDDGADNYKVVETAKIIAGSKYSRAYTDYRITRTKNLRAGIKTQQVLKLAIVQLEDPSNKRHSDYPSQKTQGYFLKLWACVAIDPRTGYKLQSGYAGELNLKQDAITIKAAKILDGMTKVQQKADVIEEPNNLAK
jgi:glutaredoxin 3